MYNLTVPMALVDLIPVICFGIAALILQRDLHGKMRSGAFALFAGGTIDIFTAGFLKAAWKLMYAAGICDFQALNTLFLPLQSIGFLMAGIGSILLLCGKAKKASVFAAAPPVFSGSFVFIGMMVLGLGSICTVLSMLAVRIKKHGAIALFAAAFVCSMAMGYMASQDSTQAWVNWVEEGINCVSQGCLLGGVFVLHKAGLKNLEL
ncbi:MAG: hypothetical protein E7335_09520 [Clostridiales bacterium]|nr:hypothetical protein [Clostridiales bacterium]